MEIAFVENGRMDPATLAFGVRAINKQLQQLAESFDEDPWTARGYAVVPDLDVALMFLQDEIDEAAALGYHDLAAGRPFGRCKIAKDPDDWTTASHEACELARDPYVNLWLPLPDGRRIAYECADPVQSDEYSMQVAIGSETRSIWLSDFVLPAYFVQGAPPPYSFLNTIDEPFGTSRNGGGWRLVRDPDGRVTSEFGPLGATPELEAAMARRAKDPGSRTHRRGVRQAA